MKDMQKQVATVAAKWLQKVLKTEANTASSIMAYQPKAPEELNRFRNTK